MSLVPTTCSHLHTLKYPRLWLTGGLLLIALLIGLSLAPHVPGPSLAGADKLAHVLMYLTVMLWFAGIYLRSNWWRVGLLLVLLGAVIELLQATTGWREGDWGDGLMNLAGVGLGMLAARLGADGWCRAVEQRWLSS